MAEADRLRFLDKVRQLNAFVAMTEANGHLQAALSACSHHQEVVELARSLGFEIGRRWGEEPGRTPDADNLLAGTCPPAGEEHTTVLLTQGSLRLERIHSCQARSAPGFWYDQREWEWVTLLQGSAQLQFADEDQPRDLSRGDQLLLPPHRRHRVLATDPAPGTVWLALFWPGG